MSVIVTVFVVMIVIVVILVSGSMGVLVAMGVSSRMVMMMGMGLNPRPRGFVLRLMTMVVVRVMIIIMGQVDIELHPGDVRAFGTGEMQVEFVEAQSCEFPLQRGRLDPQIQERADEHVAADPAEDVQVDRLHPLLLRRVFDRVRTLVPLALARPGGRAPSAAASATRALIWLAA